MNRFNRSPSAEYRAFVEAVREYASHDHEPGEDVRRAIADALEDELRERFKDYWTVNETADTTCLRRTITGEDECNCDRSWIDRERETEGEGDTTSRRHSTLWLDEDDEPAVYSMHVYHPEIQTVSEKRNRTQSSANETAGSTSYAVLSTGVEIAVMPVSWLRSAR